jgi:2-hydroxy-3-keto-5-methylthiopentenyl-1-phosphate phosphatase
MIPKIEFRYSRIYDSKYRDGFEKKGEKYPSSEEILEHIRKINDFWDKENKIILKEISKVTKLKWKEKKIICYIIGKGRSFSDPLTMRIFDKIEYFRDTLIHELIHQIQMQNDLKKWFEYVNEIYKEETKLTKNHILLDAFLSKIIERLYGKDRLKEIINSQADYPDYKRAWDIVGKEKANKIIKKFKKINSMEVK